MHYIDAFIQGQLVMSNCVLPLCEIENKIIEGHVQLAQIDNFLIVLVERECHYDFYYYRKPDAQLPMVYFPTDKPILLSEVYGRSSERIEEDSSYWKYQGFKPYKRSFRMMKKLPDEMLDTKDFEYIRFLNLEEIELIKSSMMKWFDPIADQIPTQQELFTAINEHRIFGIYQSEKQLKGFLYFTVEKNYVILMHIGVNPNYRKQGIGGLLLKYFTGLCMQTGKKRIYAWVNQDNLSSQKMHERHGYVLDGKVVNKMIYNGHAQF